MQDTELQQFPANEDQSGCRRGRKAGEQRGRLEDAKQQQLHGFAKSTGWSWGDKVCIWVLQMTKFTGWSRVRICHLSQALLAFKRKEHFSLKFPKSAMETLG